MNKSDILGKLLLGDNVEVDGVEYIVIPHILIRKDVILQLSSDTPIKYDYDRHIWVAGGKTNE